MFGFESQTVTIDDRLITIAIDDADDDAVMNMSLPKVKGKRQPKKACTKCVAIDYEDVGIRIILITYENCTHLGYNFFSTGYYHMYMEPNFKLDTVYHPSIRLLHEECYAGRFDGFEAILHTVTKLLMGTISIDDI